MMLERSGELRSRLLGAFVPLPYIHIGQHWHPNPRSRWDTVMSSRFSVVQELARRRWKDWCPAPARNSDMSCGFAFLVYNYSKR